MEQFVVLKPSKNLIEERAVIWAEPSGSGTLQHGVGEEDLWFVVFDDVVLNCQRTGTTLLPTWSANRRSNASSTPGAPDEVSLVNTEARDIQGKLRNLYKFIKGLLRCLCLRYYFS